MSKNKTKKLALLISSCLIVSMFAGCGSTGKTDSDSSKTATTKDTLVVATAYNAKSLDPQAVNDVAFQTS